MLIESVNTNSRLLKIPYTIQLLNPILAFVQQYFIFLIETTCKNCNCFRIDAYFYLIVIAMKTYRKCIKYWIGNLLNSYLTNNMQFRYTLQSYNTRHRNYFHKWKNENLSNSVLYEQSKSSTLQSLQNSYVLYSTITICVIQNRHYMKYINHYSTDKRADNLGCYYTVCVKMGFHYMYILKYFLNIYENWFIRITTYE